MMNKVIFLPSSSLLCFEELKHVKGKSSTVAGVCVCVWCPRRAGFLRTAPLSRDLHHPWVLASRGVGGRREAHLRKQGRARDSLGWREDGPFWEPAEGQSSSKAVVQNTVSVVCCEDWCFSQLSLQQQNTIDQVASRAMFVPHSSGGWKSVCPPQ